MLAMLVGWGDYTCSAMRVSALALPLALALSLGSCSLIQQPEPNAALINLAAQARHEADIYQTPALKELRAQDAEELIAEAMRACGHRDSGEQPETCTYEAIEQDVGEAETDPRQGLELFDVSAQLTLDATPQVPQDAMAVLVPQVIDLVKAGAAAPVAGAAQLQPSKELKSQGVKTGDLEADADDAREALAAEYGARYGLGVALGYADAAGRQRISALLESHQQRIDVLEASLEPTGEVPVAEPAYRFAGTTPSDPSTALEAANMIQDTLTQRYSHLASLARTASWRELSTALAAQTAAE
ncbi:hypothetical protein CPELA_04475 [Corynebacterium pelargi]|uniref:DUF4439 domain-containing protein n=2 Tax=Corynebacterium pelargi TaxID=1471400 RepID=A0A410W890_9CORY|nr:hypothetical protein CPELA_04475 [Corynebacterium pelargi]